MEARHVGQELFHYSFSMPIEEQWSTACWQSLYEHERFDGGAV